MWSVYQALQVILAQALQTCSKAQVRWWTLFSPPAIPFLQRSAFVITKVILGRLSDVWLPGRSENRGHPVCTHHLPAHNPMPVTYIRGWGLNTYSLSVSRWSWASLGVGEGEGIGPLRDLGP